MRLPEKPPVPGFSETEGLQFLDAWQNHELRAKLTSIEKEYPYWDAFKYKVKDLAFDASLLWKINKFSRHANKFSISLSDNVSAFKFQYNTTSTILQYLHHFDMNLGGVLEGRSIVPPEDKHRYLISSIMEEAIASSQLEGASTTREKAKQMLKENKAPRDTSERMIMNNYQTIQKVMQLKDEKLSPQIIRELHRLITTGTLEKPENEGRFRQNNEVNVVDYMSNEIVYTPPSFEHLDHLIDRFCAFANEELEEPHFVHPIVRAVLLHFLMGYIHPFVDGNGRAARAIFYWYLIRKGYWLVEYMSISRIILQAPAQYARSYLYSEYDGNDVTYFLMHNLKCMDLALKSLQQYIERKLMEKQQWIHLIRHEPINERQAELIRTMILENKSMYTIREVQSMFGVVYQTARTDLMGLAALGFLEEKKQGKKNLFFRSDNFDERVAQQKMPF